MERWGTSPSSRIGLLSTPATVYMQSSQSSRPQSRMAARATPNTRSVLLRSRQRLAAREVPKCVLELSLISVDKDQDSKFRACPLQLQNFDRNRPKPTRFSLGIQTQEASL